MALTPSTMLPLDTPAPSFTLKSTEGKTITLDNYTGNPLLVMFICNHCPYVKHIADELSKLGREYQDQDVGIVAIMSNDVLNYPDDRPERMKSEKATRGYTFPYLYDEDQSVAKAYRAACTPDFYIFDSHHHLKYRGQLDDSRPGNDIPVTGGDLRAALDAVLAGEPVTSDQKPSMGCNIKWKAGNEPGY